jgi:SecD/SecF fusion protein
VAVKNGSKSSLSAIVDANITTFIVALIMFNFGESSIKGFATMLMITVVVTMLTMVVLTRAMLKLFTKDGFFDKHPQLFINIKKKDIPDVSKNEKVKKVPFGKVNFFKHKYSLVLLSLFIITAGSVTFAMKGLPLGIDYKAGTSVTIVTNKKVTEKQIREDFKENKLEVATINVGKEETSVRINSALDGESVKKINKYFEEKYDAKVNIGVISNVVAKELVKNAILAVLISMIGIILYISIRFNLSYALGGVVALFHDAAIMLAFFVMTRFEISSMFIAAVLAIIGYSINDTIVIFDRFREEIKKTKEKITKENFESICNRAVQATFTRTLLTSITTLVPIVALLVIGSKEILTFNVAMLVGLVSGTYSSIFIAGLIFISIERRKLGKPKKKKIVYTDDFEEKKIKGINC